MIIHNPETKLEKGKFIITSQIEYDHDHDLPNELWFSVEEQHREYTSSRVDAFASSLILLASAIGEDIEVRGEFSPQLMFGLREYLKIQAFWSGSNHTININADSLTPSKRNSDKFVASCNISGGIDSFYTLWSQLPENEPIAELQIQYGIYGEGLSFPVTDGHSRNSYAPNLKKLINSLGLELLVVNSNLPQFRVPNDVWIGIGRGRTAIPLLFSPLITNHFIPSTHSYYALKPWPAHPLLDHLYSIESLRIFTHAAEFNRFEKLKKIANWPPLYEFLQVCNRINLNTLNCCRCNKCYQTMIPLDILGVKDNTTAFHLPLRKIDLLQNYIDSYDLYLQFNMMANHAWSEGKLGIIPFLYLAILKYPIVKWAKWILHSRFGKFILGRINSRP